MPLPLPPKSTIRGDAKTAQLVHDQLTSVIAGHAQATTTYRFYEELDVWLGPWRQQGYPIAYGKFYNIAFSSNEKLMASPKASDWVWRTTIKLQEALRDYVVARVRDGTLPSITEPELRRAAFNSHPAAYDSGGLAMLALVAPELIPIVATIPGREFCPTSENFTATVRQFFETLARMSPQMVGNSLAALVGPAHTGILGRAVRRDQQLFSSELALSRQLAELKAEIERGNLDYLPALDQIIAALNARQFPDQGFARTARMIIETAEGRRERILRNTDRLLEQSPPVRARVKAAFPNFLRSH